MQRRSLQKIALGLVAIIGLGYLLGIGQLARLPDNQHVGSIVFIDESADLLVKMSEPYYGKGDDYFLLPSQPHEPELSPSEYRIRGLYRIERRGLNKLKEPRVDLYMLEATGSSQSGAKRIFLLQHPFERICGDPPKSDPPGSFATYTCPKTRP